MVLGFYDGSKKEESSKERKEKEINESNNPFIFLLIHKIDGVL